MGKHKNLSFEKYKTIIEESSNMSIEECNLLDNDIEESTKVRDLSLDGHDFDTLILLLEKKYHYLGINE